MSYTMCSCSGCVVQCPCSDRSDVNSPVQPGQRWPGERLNGIGGGAGGSVGSVGVLGVGAGPGAGVVVVLVGAKRRTMSRLLSALLTI